MPSQRDAIRMSEEELARFLADGRVVTCATIGPHGRPHLMPLWYVMSDGVITAWTFAKSQKVRNLQRRPQATVQVEAGDTYDELRGAMLECEVEIVDDLETVTTIGAAITIKYLGLSDVTPQSPEVRASLARQAPKRVGLRFHPTRTVTWDHRKLRGAS